MRKGMGIVGTVNKKFGGDKKMKKKIAILVGIAVCAILLTSPVLASAGYSKIYGNANEDDVLDMRDVTYIKLVIFGKKPATAFADANYDGKISMLDIGQTKLIILGKEKKLTLIEQFNRIVTINKPVERVVTLLPEGTRVMVALGAADKLVGVDKYSSTRSFGDIYPTVFPELKELPIVGVYNEPNIEFIVSLRPDLIFGGWVTSPEDSDNIQEKTGTPVVGIYTFKNMEGMFTEINLVGTVLGKEKEAEELISYCNNKIDKVTEVTSEIPNSEKPTVYLGFWKTITKTPVIYDPVDLAGGINVAGNLPGTFYAGTAVEVSIEQIIAWNPDIILIHHPTKIWGPPIDEVLSDPRLQTINAVKNRKVFHTLGMWQGWDHPRVFTETVYMAKLFHPEEFEDLDVEKEGNEIFERFYHIDGLWTELGTELGYL